MKKRGLYLLCVLFLAGVRLFAQGGQENAPLLGGEIYAIVAEINGVEFPSALGAAIPADLEQTDLVKVEPGRAELIMKALAAAYPDRIGPAEFRDGDWAVQVYGEWFYYAEGRLLPEELRNQASAYSAQLFYNYPAELPPWTVPSEEESERLRNEAKNRTANRSQHFCDALLRAGNRDDAWDRVKTLRFLGISVTVHYSILSPLSLVEYQILKEAKTKPAVRQWINNLNTIEGWYWRVIEGTTNRSFHSYGTAIDLVPKSLGRLETYWLWTSRNNLEWWKVPYSRRFHPPDEVIKAFESYGFVWGGKWDTFDTMHFEYRPEILVFNNIPMAQYH